MHDSCSQLHQNVLAFNEPKYDGDEFCGWKTCENFEYGKHRGLHVSSLSEERPTIFHKLRNLIGINKRERGEESWDRNGRRDVEIKSDTVATHETWIYGKSDDASATRGSQDFQAVQWLKTKE